MNFNKFLAFVFSILFVAGKLNAFGFETDLNGDGIKDSVSFSYKKEDPEKDTTLTGKITIILGGSNDLISGNLSSDSGVIDVRPGKKTGELVIDYTNRTSRDSAELNYDVYEWSRDLNKICLHSSVSGVPANQLKRELIPSNLSISFYDGCASFNESISARKVSVIPSISIEKIAENYREGELPEWAALEISTQIGPSSIDKAVQIALLQKKYKNWEGAIIILEAASRFSPQNKEIKQYLNDVYLAAGGRDLSVLRCGWLKQVNKKNISLIDADADWSIKVKSDQNLGNDLLQFNLDQWISKDVGTRYGCACLRVVSDNTAHEISKIFSASPKPLSACRKDAKLTNLVP